MPIDHIAITIVWPLYLNDVIVDGVHMMGNDLPERARKLYLMYIIMRSIGRLTYPIFDFMLVEGFLHTRSFKKYSWRLLLCALISEIPYDLAMSGKIISFDHQNIIWSLLIGLIMLYFIERVEKCGTKKRILLTTLFILIIIWSKKGL